MSGIDEGYELARRKDVGVEGKSYGVNAVTFLQAAVKLVEVIARNEHNIDARYLTIDDLLGMIL